MLRTDGDAKMRGMRGAALCTRERLGCEHERGRRATERALQILRCHIRRRFAAVVRPVGSRHFGCSHIKTGGLGHLNNATAQPGAETGPASLSDGAQKSS